MNTQVYVIIKGTVQGVFYRSSTKEKADTLNLKGWVQNHYDGSVHAMFQGPSDTIQDMLNWCKTGPEHATVTDIETQPIPTLDPFSDFSIR